MTRNVDRQLDELEATALAAVETMNEVLTKQAVTNGSLRELDRRVNLVLQERERLRKLVRMFFDHISFEDMVTALEATDLDEDDERLLNEVTRGDR